MFLPHSARYPRGFSGCKTNVLHAATNLYIHARLKFPSQKNAALRDFYRQISVLPCMMREGGLDSPRALAGRLTAALPCSLSAGVDQSAQGAQNQLPDGPM